MNEQEVRYQQAQERVKALKEFYLNLGAYVIVNFGLFLINMAVSPTNLWFVWPLMGWGIGLAVHAFSVFGMSIGSSWERRKIAEFMQEE